MEEALQQWQAKKKLASKLDAPGSPDGSVGPASLYSATRSGRSSESLFVDCERDGPVGTSRAPDFQGYLLKQGRPPCTVFKRRWCELRSGTLFWYSDVGGRLKGSLSMLFCTLRDDTEGDSGFLLLDCGTPYFFRAGSVEEKKAWVKHLESSISLASVASPLVTSESSVFRDDASSVELLFDKSTPSSPCVSNAAKASASSPLCNGRKKISLNDFELISVIGKGSFGKVLKVRRKDRGSLHAMKVMSKDALIKANMVEYTLKEKQILAQIEHPFIVSLYWAFQTKAKLYLVMDFLSGGELYVHLRRQGRFKEDRAKFYCAQITLAFEYLHSLNIIFRDLKPENVVLNHDGYACLTDFGMAKRFTQNDRTSSFCGTDAYVSPEMIRGEEYACENDWWSLGILLFEMIQGDVPFYSEVVSQMYEQILQAPLVFSRSISAEAKDILANMLARDKMKRLASATTIKNHAFFKDFDFTRLLRKQLPPPFVPDLKNDDTRYFDVEKPMLSVCKPPPEEQNRQFDGFSYPGPQHTPSFCERVEQMVPTVSVCCPPPASMINPSASAAMMAAVPSNLYSCASTAAEAIDICRSNPDVEYIHLVGSDCF